MRRPSRFAIRPGIARLFRLAIHRPDLARADADDEIALHLALRVEQLQRQGLSLQDARIEAERRFGPLDEARQTLHSSSTHRENRMRVRDWMDGARHNLRFSLRGLRRNPGFTATAVLCLALGIGANAATFSMLDELILSPMPVHEPGRLVNLAAPGTQVGNDNCNQSGGCDEVFSYPMFRDLAREQRVFTDIGAHRIFSASIASHEQPAFAEGVLVSGSYFSVLGLRPALGRLIGLADDETIGAHRIAVLSHAYWTRLGADSAVIGTTVLVNNQALTVVGVAPRGYEGPTRGMQPLIYVPLTMRPVVDPWFGPATKMNDRRAYWVYLFARLRPDVTIEQARTGMAVVHGPVLANVEAPLLADMSAQAVARFKARPLLIEDGSRGQSSLQGETRTPLLFLFSITGLVVLIACANIANLLLARGATRTTEMAVRLSLGASRGRLIGQLLIESCMLAVIGGVASLGVANITLAAIASVIPPAGGVGLGADLSLDIRPSVLAFSAALSLATGVLFGMFPALHSTRSDLITAVRAGGGHASAGRSASRFRSSLVAAQIALSMALLIAAGLFVRSLRNVSRVDLGLRVDNVVTFGLAPVLNGYDHARSHALFIRLEDQLRALPGVVSVAGSGTPLLAGSSSGTNVRVEGFKRDPDTDANTRLNAVGAGFFRTLQLPVIAGREFTPADRAGAPKVAIVNEAFAKKFNLGANPIGKRMARDGDNNGGALDIVIVGFVRDAKYNNVKADMPALFYTPDRQASDVGGMIYYVRTAGAPEGMLRSVEGVVAKLDPNLPVVSLKTMAQQVKESTYLDRMISMLSGAFAIVATLLTAVGLYGVLAFTVAQRTREIALRMALGADASRVRGLVLRQVARLTLIGGVIGIAAALGIGRAAQSLLFGLDGYDPLTVVTATVMIAIVALAAGYVPAWRASRVEPMAAMRSD